MRNLLFSMTPVVAMLVLLSSGDCSAQEDSSTKFTKQEIQKIYQNCLEAEGDEPSISSDGNVDFMVGPFKHTLLVRERSPELLQMVVMLPVEIDEDNIAPYLVFANQVSLKARCAKLVIAEGRLMISVETYIESPKKMGEALKRVKFSSLTAMKVMNDAMNEVKEKSGSQEG